MKKVLLISASDTDLGLMKEVGQVMDEFGVEYELTISSAHRSPERTKEIVADAQSKSIKVIICGAGLAAHLAGVVAAQFPLPVIGIPIQGGSLKGLDALLATVQMPPGIPVATVGINNTRNAGILAVQILATSDDTLKAKIVEYKNNLSLAVEEKALQLDKLGIEEYLSQKK